MSSFKTAKKTAVPLKIALQGISFSGKTMSAIKLAKGLAKDKPVFLLDTENDSALLYDHLGFLQASITPPFKPEKYISLIREAVDAGAGAVVVDSLSHAWQYILDYKDQLDQAGGRGPQWSNWAKAKPLWQGLKDAILQSPVHVVVTFREKSDYAVDSNDDGKGGRRSEVKKLGTKAIAEEGSEYEFTTVWKLDKDTHLARVEKDRTGLFDGRTFLIDEGVGQELLQWMGDGDFAITAEWDAIRQGESDDFKKAAEESDASRKDQARSIAQKRKIPNEVVTALLAAAKAKSLDGIQLIIDADRYGANDGEKVIRFVCTKTGNDPVALIRTFHEKNRPGTTSDVAITSTKAAPSETVPAPKEEPKKDPPKEPGQDGQKEPPKGPLDPKALADKMKMENAVKAQAPATEKIGTPMTPEDRKGWPAGRVAFMEIAGDLGWNMELDGRSDLRTVQAAEILLKKKFPGLGHILDPDWSNLCATLGAIRSGEVPEPKEAKGWK